MKKIIYTTIMALATVLVGCEKFTDITPKGRNLLNTAADLDLLLNYDFQGFSNNQLARLVNAATLGNLQNLQNQQIPTINQVLTFWREDVDRKSLTATDVLYTEIYNIIGRYCNPIIGRAGIVTGDKDLAQQAKAEALILRAWMHYLAVNIFAKAYNPATAATDGGVAYVFETDMLRDDQPKYTVAKVYEFIVRDLDSAFALKALKVRPPGQQVGRVSLSFAHAVRAQVMLSLRRYNDAYAAARTSLAINNHLDNHNDMLRLTTPAISGDPKEYFMFWRPQFRGNREDLWETWSTMVLWALTPEMITFMDPNSVFLNHVASVINRGGIDNSMTTVFLPGFLQMTHNFDQTAFSGAGLTTADMFRIVAECYMRSNRFADAQKELEHIRKHRIIADKYEPLAPLTTRDGVFALLKQSARSDNWSAYKDFIDLKRWNTYPEFAANLYRTFGTQPTLTLRPDSPLWIFPFPQNATNFNPNLTHNY